MRWRPCIGLDIDGRTREAGVPPLRDTTTPTRARDWPTCYPTGMGTTPYRENASPAPRPQPTRLPRLLNAAFVLVGVGVLLSFLNVTTSRESRLTLADPRRPEVSRAPPLASLAEESAAANRGVRPVPRPSGGAPVPRPACTCRDGDPLCTCIGDGDRGWGQPPDAGRVGGFMSVPF